MSSGPVALSLQAQEDVVLVRQAVRSLAVKIGLNLVDQTKIITAASELARNTVVYGGGGKVTVEEVTLAEENVYFRAPPIPVRKAS